MIPSGRSSDVHLHDAPPPLRSPSASPCLEKNPSIQTLVSAFGNSPQAHITYYHIHIVSTPDMLASQTLFFATIVHSAKLDPAQIFAVCGNSGQCASELIRAVVTGAVVRRALQNATAPCCAATA